MGSLFQDLRYGVRMLAKSPGFTAVAVITLALGIGANTAIFSVVNAALLQPLPYKDSNRLVTFWASNPQIGYAGPASVCDPDFTSWRDQSKSLADMAGLRGATANLTGVGEPVRLNGWDVTASFFSLLQVSPEIGRPFSPEEERPGHNHVVVLSHKLWQTRFGSNASAVGQAIKLDGEFYTVIGVMPLGFAFPNQADYWKPAELAADCHNISLRVVARLKPGVTIESGRANVAAVARNLDAAEHQNRYGVWHLTLIAIQQELSANLRPSLLALLAAVGMVLLIACANVANLLLARATARQREIAVRRALGAGRTRLVLQLLTESLLLALLGGGLGLVLAAWGRDGLVSLIPRKLAQPGFLARIASLNLDLWVLGFAVILSVLTGILFGLAPAIQVTNISLNESLKEGSRGSSASLAKRGLQGTFVISQVAMASVLLIGAGVLIRSFVSLMKVDRGFDPQNVLTMNVDLPETDYQTAAQMVDFEKQAVGRLERLPAVRAAGLVFGLPLGQMWIRGDFTIEGQPAPKVSPSKHVIGGDYFQAIGTRLLKGRYFNDHDSPDSPRVAIVSDSMARRFWPKGDAIGKRINPGFSNSGWCEIVGVVKSIKQFSLSENEESSMAMYLPYAQAPIPFLMRFVTFAVRASSDPARFTEPARHAITTVDPDLPVYGVAAMQELVSQAVSEPWFNTVMLGIFAALAFVLAMVGIYGVMSFTVTQRTHEIGVRMALGAERKDVLMLVVGEAMVLTLVGVGVGLGAAFGLTRFLSSFLFGVRPSDPLTFAAVTVLLIAVATAASFLPARRATKVDPMVALRYE